MAALVAQHPWLALCTALLLGMTVEWVLEFLFVRRRMFDLERLLNEKERDYTELRHSHGRTLNDLKNKLTELDAVQKSKVLSDTALAARDRDLATARVTAEGLARKAAELEAADSCLRSDLEAARTALDDVRRERASGEADLAAARDSQRDLALQVAQLTARLETEIEALRALRAVDEARTAELGATRDEAVRLQADLAARESALASVKTALRGQDATISDLQARIRELEGERTSVASALARADEEVRRLRESVADLESRLASGAPDAPPDADDKEARARWEARLEAMAGELAAARAESESLGARLRNAEETARAAEHAGSAPSPVPDATRKALEEEKASLNAQVGRLQSNIAAATRARGEAEERIRALEAEVARLESAIESAAAAAPADDFGRISGLEAELAAVSESHARLESELAALRERGIRAQAGPVGGDLDAILADLDAVTRERNELAAELAGLRAEGRQDGGGRRRGDGPGED